MVNDPDEEATEYGGHPIFSSFGWMTQKRKLHFFPNLQASCARLPRFSHCNVQSPAVTVTVGYSDSFGNPWFITNKTPPLTVTKNRLQWHLLPHFSRFLRHHMSKLTPEIDFLDDFTLVNCFLSSYWSKINGLRAITENEGKMKAPLSLSNTDRGNCCYSDTYADPRGCHCNRRPLYNDRLEALNR